MALISCPDCGKEFSDSAAACPSCGRPNGRLQAAEAKAPEPKKPVSGCVGCLAIIVVLMVVGGISNAIRGPKTDVPSSTAAHVKPSGTSATDAGQWSYAHTVDEMTSKPVHRASLESENTVSFGFPYEGAQHGTLLVRRHPRFGHDVVFSIERGQLLCPSYDGCSVLVRFDEAEPTRFTARPPGDHSSESIFISDYDRFVSKLKSAKVVRISPKVYQQGTVVFTFNVAGFSTNALAGKSGG